MSIGRRIKTMRFEQGLSIDDLADKLGKNRTTVYRYENGDIENLPLGILDTLASALDTTPAYLMGWENANINENMAPEAKVFSKWFSEYGLNRLTEDERLAVMEYAKFLVWKRNR